MANEIAVKGTAVVDNQDKLKGSLGASQKQAGGTGEPAPTPEVTIRDSFNGGSAVRKFVTANIEAITDTYSFTTVFIDTELEYKRYGVSVPSVALICTDLRKTVASLKRDPLVVRFNKSKTLKRVSEWQKDKFKGFEKPVWYSMYSSAKATRAAEQVDESEEMSDMTYLGYLNEDGTVAVAPCVGETIEMEGRMYPIVEADDCYIVQNGSYTLRLDESEISEDIELDESECDGLMVGDYVVIGLYEDCLVLSDANDFCYLYEAALDVKSNGVQQGALVLTINGKTYKYTSEQYSANELEEKFNAIAKHSAGKAFAWVKKHCVTQDSYAKPKRGPAKTVFGTAVKKEAVKNGGTVYSIGGQEVVLLTKGGKAYIAEEKGLKLSGSGLYRDDGLAITGKFTTEEELKAGLEKYYIGRVKNIKNYAKKYKIGSDYTPEVAKVVNGRYGSIYKILSEFLGKKDPDIEKMIKAAKQLMNESEEDLFEACEGLDEADLDIKETAVNGNAFTIHINGKKYSYYPAPEGGLTPKELKAKFDSIAKHSKGRALAWLKKNSTTRDSYRNVSESEGFIPGDVVILNEEEFTVISSGRTKVILTDGEDTEAVNIRDLMEDTLILEKDEEGDIKMVFGRRYVFRGGEWVHDESAKPKRDEKTGKEKKVKKAGIFDGKLKKKSKEDEKVEAEEAKKAKDDLRSIGAGIHTPKDGGAFFFDTRLIKGLDQAMSRVRKGKVLSQEDKDAIRHGLEVKKKWEEDVKSILTKYKDNPKKAESEVEKMLDEKYYKTKNGKPWNAYSNNDYL